MNLQPVHKPAAFSLANFIAVIFFSCPSIFSVCLYIFIVFVLNIPAVNFPSGINKVFYLSIHLSILWLQRYVGSGLATEDFKQPPNVVMEHETVYFYFT